jgi:phosphatidylglycerol lysyltransferase
VSERLRSLLLATIGLLVFLLALEVLRIELRAVSWNQLTADVFATPPSRLALALLFTAANYALLTGYDFLAFAYIGRVLPRGRVAAASFLAYAIANNVGLSILSGASIRYRFYTRWGVTAEELSKIVFSYSVTFWLGLLTLGGVSFALGSLPADENVPAGVLIAPIGWILMMTGPAFVLFCLVRREPFRVGRFELPLPSPRLALAQLTVSALEWALAGAVLYALLPPSGLSFLTFLGSFLSAILLGLVSHVPGGIGVFEGLMVLFLKPYIGSAQLLPALIAYRAIYYLLPLVIALIALLADEIRMRRPQAARVTAALGQITQAVTPRLLSIFTFLAGIVLLLSGATPAAPGRLDVLSRLFPLGLIELSHFLGSVVGALLLILSQGLSRRLDAAYYLAFVATAIAIPASLLKGLDFEEAMLLTLLLIVLWRARPAFDRRAAFFDTRFSNRWIASVLAAVSASIWLGLFAFKHVNYSQQLWWQFALRAEASRFLRASVGAAMVVLLFGAARLMRPAAHEVSVPTEEDLADAGRAIATQPYSYPNLVYLKDKGLLFNETRTAFVMYQVQGRTWVSLGDPVGPPDQVSGLIRLFLERCDDFDGVPVFYEVRKDNLHCYADLGLTFIKLGEEARVDLHAFSLDGSRASRFRKALRRMERDGTTVRIVAPPEVATLMGELRAVSDDWLARRAGAEKGFSLGFFDESYLSRFPVAVVEHNGRIQAFANLWPGQGDGEVSVDLMRFRHDAPRDVMEALFAFLLQWGKEQGYRWFALGMAPLAGVERSPVETLWNRLGSLLYEHGEFVYKFQGLRSFKNKFDPVWEAHYLAYPGGMRLPRILADVAALIAGGYRRIFLR